MSTYSQVTIHTEKVVQEALSNALVTGEGYIRRDPRTDYDRPLAMDKALVVQFLKSTQADEWQKLEDHYSANAEETLFKQLDKALKDLGTLEVLRSGIKIVPGIKFALFYLRPASTLEPARVAEYEANILSVMDEVVYPAKRKAAADVAGKASRIDTVLFLNGLPIITLEMKNTTTGTTYKNAEVQYRKDRSPAGEPLLTFKRGALVHFALDQDNVSMATRLANGKTRFLPFNRGHDGGAGNGDIDGEFRIAYLYKSGPWGKAVFGREVLLDIIGRFMFLEVDGKNEVMIFPRFQQLDAVRSLLGNAAIEGSGQNYLVQHSAGSGKSKTIAWLAHQAINLHDADNQAVFNTAIIVTDRVVLDRQLQKQIKAFEQTDGVVKVIDGTSRQLREAIARGARIIVTTIQKFSTAHLAELSGQSGKNSAIIVDEAHSSQSGKSAQAMTGALTRAAESSEDIEDLILESQRSRGPQKNISFFAFTATPRNVTLERFGHTDANGKPTPFHLYSMRQAIEEDFILDVLQNYSTYKAYYELEKAIEDNPELSGKKGARRVAKYASLHPTAIGQKVEIIVEHFRRHVAKELDGQAKAMIVTQSREHALRYYYAVKKYVGEAGQGDVKALVAFSGDLTLDDGKPVKESELNGFSETELPQRFDGFKKDGTPFDDTYHVLIVAEKYQTGFDQPKLCAMYVDRKLAGLQAVQTLARLNRTRAGKEKTFILDFQNTTEDIQEAFRPFFEATSIEERTDPNQLYQLESCVRKFGYIDDAEIDRFAEIFFRGVLRDADRPLLESLVRAAVHRFEQDGEDEERQEEFRQLLKSYNRFYAFMAQVISLQDSDLEKLAAYGGWLARILPNREMPPEIAVTDDMIRLSHFRVEEKEVGDASLTAGDTRELTPISDFGAKPLNEEEMRELSEIIADFNQRRGTEFTERDMVRGDNVKDDIMGEDMRQMIKNNPEDVVWGAFEQKFFQSLIRSFQTDKELSNVLLTNPESRRQFTRFFFKRAVNEVKEAA